MATCQVMGITETIYVGEKMSGHNCHFEVDKCLMTKHRIYVKKDGVVTCISLRVDDYESYSGWCVGTVARLECEPVEPLAHMPFTHVPNQPLTIDAVDGDDDCIENVVFSYSADGGDKYYPAGSYDIHWDKFHTTPRYKEKRVVYVLTGESGIGKTYLANHLQDIDVYETDMDADLPECIYADVVVLGNRSRFTLDQVRARIFQPVEVVVCRLE